MPDAYDTEKVGGISEDGKCVFWRKKLGSFASNGSAVKHTVRKGYSVSSRIEVEKGEIKMILK